MTEEPGTDTDTDTATEPTGGPGRTVPAGAFVLAVMVAAALGILAVVALAMDGEGAGGSAGGSELDDARFAAARFAERFLTISEESLDTWRDEIEPLATAGFVDEVEDVEESLRRLVAEAELDAEGVVTDVYMGEIERGAVTAVVAYDRQVRSSSGPRSEAGYHMLMSLLRVDGQWLVDNVVDIGTFATAGADPTAPSTTTTSSTAPG